MSYIGQNLPTDVFGGYTTDTFAGDGSATTFTLSQAPFNEQGLIVVINNVIQQPTTNYTVSGTTLTIVGTAVASGDVIYARHTGVALPIGEANALDLQGQSDKLILDADADTTISADTDDQIDFKAGGTDIMSLTATTATFNDGVTISVADNTDTLTLTSTDADANQGPVLNFKRDSSSPADDDILGQLTFTGENDASEAIEFVRIRAGMVDVTDGTEDSRYNITTYTGGSQYGRLNIEAGETVFNENSADLDFRVESNDVSDMLYVDAGNNSVLINKSSPSLRYFNSTSFKPGFEIFGTGNTEQRMSAFTYGSTDAGGHLMVFGKSRSATVDDYTIVQDDDQLGRINFQGADGTDFVNAAAIHADVDGTPGANDMPGRLEFHTTADGGNDTTERMRIDSLGAVMIGKTTLDVNANGIELRGISSHSLISVATDGNTGLYIARNTNDGTMVAFYQASSLEGTISVSGSTVSYNAFTGGHWSRLADNSKPTILRGTIVETIDEMCDWYQAVADVAEVKYTAEDQEVIDGEKNVGDIKTDSKKVKENIALPDGKSVGDAVTFTYSFDGKEYTGKYEKDTDIKHVKCKISDTADSKKVYGVFNHWDDADDGSDGDVNDMNIAQVGTYIIRVNKDVTVEAGDLLVSNGDGTAKVQDDDIIRSKTVAKVNSNVKVETYSDGSYTVPCTLHC